MSQICVACIAYRSCWTTKMTTALMMLTFKYLARKLVFMLARMSMIMKIWRMVTSILIRVSSAVINFPKSFANNVMITFAYCAMVVNIVKERENCIPINRFCAKLPQAQTRPKYEYIYFLWKVNYWRLSMIYFGSPVLHSGLLKWRNQHPGHMKVMMMNLMTAAVMMVMVMMPSIIKHHHPR